MGRTMAVVGLGNIGSHLAPHLARMPDVTRIVLVDKGRYDKTNIRSQAITPGQAGRSKTQVQGLRLKRINPALAVSGIAMPVEAVPLGRLRADAILACVDSRAARQYLNQAARHLGVPLIDAGVHPDGVLARVSVFLPEAWHACLECTWDQADYDAIEQSYPCRSGTPDSPSTGAPAPLGALAAAVQALECERLFRGLAPVADGSHEIVIDAASHRQHVTRFARNGACRFPDHEPWDIRRLDRMPEDIPVVRALGLGAEPASASCACLHLDGIPFVTAMTCLGCGRRTPLWRLGRSIARRDHVCRSCRGRLEAAGTDIVSGLALRDIPACIRARSLRALGFESGDVFSVRRGDETRFYEIAGAGTASVGR